MTLSAVSHRKVVPQDRKTEGTVHSADSANSGAVFVWRVRMSRGGTETDLNMVLLQFDQVLPRSQDIL